MKNIIENTPKIVKLSLVIVTTLLILFFVLCFWGFNRLSSLQNDIHQRETRTSAAAVEAINTIQKSSKIEIESAESRAINTVSAIETRSATEISSIKALAIETVNAIETSSFIEVESAESAKINAIGTKDAQLNQAIKDLPWNHPLVEKFDCTEAISNNPPPINQFSSTNGNSCQLDIDLLGYTIPLGKKIDPDSQDIITQSWLVKDANQCLNGAINARMVDLNNDTQDNGSLLKPIYDLNNISYSSIFKSDIDPRNRDDDNSTQGKETNWNIMRLESLLAENMGQVRLMFISFEVPPQNGSYFGCFQMQTNEGENFGPILPVAIEVSNAN